MSSCLIACFAAFAAFAGSAAPPGTTDEPLATAIATALAEAGAQDAAPAEEPSAYVCTRRPVGMTGWAVPLTFLQDGVKLGDVFVTERRCFEVTPGRHEFGTLYWAKLDPTTTRPAATQVVDLQAGECHYFRTILGFWGAMLDDTDDRRFQAVSPCALPPAAG